MYTIHTLKKEKSVVFQKDYIQNWFYKDSSLKGASLRFWGITHGLSDHCQNETLLMTKVVLLKLVTYSVCQI